MSTFKRMFLVLLLGSVLSACTPHQDTRLTGDQQTCATMGHAAGSSMFEQCLADLNARRCGVKNNSQGNRQGTWRHVATEACTRLPGDR
jgi:hypothetical protein